MNLNELVAAAYEECGISGTPPADVATATGEAKRLLRWVRESYRQIQLQSDWTFMRAVGSLTTVASTATYAPGAFTGSPGVRAWIRWNAMIYDPAIGKSNENFLTFLKLDDFERLYRFNVHDENRPVHWTVDESNRVILGPTPDKAYEVTIRYWKTAAELTLGTDEPVFNSSYHTIIVYRAMMKYARFEAAPEIFDDAKEDYTADLRRMADEYLPDMQEHEDTLA